MTTYQHDELDKTLTTHKCTDSETFSPQTLGQTSSQSTSDDLAEEGACNNGNNISPCSTIVKQTKIGIETGKGEVERQQDRSDEIFNLFGQFDGETAVVWTNETDKKCAENGVHADGSWGNC